MTSSGAPPAVTSAGRVELRAPPTVEPDEASGAALVGVLPMLGSLGALLAMGALSGADHGRAYVATGAFALAALCLVVAQLDRARVLHRRRVLRARWAYLRYLDGVRREARDAADSLRLAARRRFPDPHDLPVHASADDPGRIPLPRDGSLPMRFGVGAARASPELALPAAGVDERADYAAAAALQRLVGSQQTVDGVPATLDLATTTRIQLSGPRQQARSLARAMVCSAVATHPPTRLAVAVLCDEGGRPLWDWLKWLPHALDQRSGDAAGPARLVATSAGTLADLMADAPEGRHLLLVVDGTDLPDGRPGLSGPGVTLVEVGGGTRRDRGLTEGEVRIELDREAATVHWADRPASGCVSDRCDPVTAEALARGLARPTAASTTTGLGLSRLPGPAGSAAVAVRWAPRPARDRLRVGFGVGASGEPVHLDLKEAARGGMGPHGLVVGATGSGKSELLRTLVLGLALTHPPDDLALVLVDFKGGATFAGVAGLPHVSALVTNLAGELALVDRAEDVLGGELVRRQELLRAAGNIASVHDYERARSAGTRLPPLPALLIVVDEFTELLAARPDFIDLFGTIGRVGRSLGLHLLLASQRLDEGRLRGLDAHLSYRICLRTFSAAESLAVLGAPDAAALPPTPGVGYLRTHPESLVRFSATYVSDSMPARAPLLGSSAVLPYTVAPVGTRRSGPLLRSCDVEASFLDQAVGAMTGLGPTAHRMWLPPMGAPETLGGLLPDLGADPLLGLTSAASRIAGPLRVPVGIVDRPRAHRRDTLTLDLTGAHGHVAVVGAPRSGTSTLLCTLVAGLALSGTPRETRIFVLDFGGGTLGAFSGLPHVAAVADRSDLALARRAVVEARRILDHRDAGAGDDGVGDVFVVVDGWSSMRGVAEDLEWELQDLAQRGLGFGVHLVVGTTRWSDLRTSLRDLFGTRLELRLGDPQDSEVDRRTAALVPTTRPGRGLTHEGLHFLAALPRIDGVAETDTLGAGVDDLVARVAGAWSGPTVPRLRPLPRRVGLDQVRRLAPVDRRLLLGLAERTMAPVGLDLHEGGHLLVFGDTGSGKTAVLRTCLREIVRSHSPHEAQLVLVDHRRALLGEASDDHVLHDLVSDSQIGPALAELAVYLQGRLPGPDVTARQLHDKSWWSGADVFVLVDDYDLVAPTSASPLHALVPLLPYARDIGLHLFLARRASGSARALHDPVLQRLRDLAVPGLLLSGSPSEGPLVGDERPTPAPPGRGRLVTRGRDVEALQIAWTDPVTLPSAPAGPEHPARDLPGGGAHEVLEGT
jgi:DNA segregation ATPase FtsK/SpoIIIE, S-DNA-T family